MNAFNTTKCPKCGKEVYYDIDRQSHIHYDDLNNKRHRCDQDRYVGKQCEKCKQSVWFNRNNKRLYLNSTNDDDIHECYPEQKYCSHCHKEVNDVAGDPGLWPFEFVSLAHNNERRIYCHECILKAIAAYEDPVNFM